MPQSISIEQAQYLFREYGSWFGSPVIVLHGETLDGRARLTVLNDEFKRGAARNITIPTVSAHSSGDAAKLLCLAGHYDRARKLIPAAFTSAIDIAAYCHCDVSIVAPITAHRQASSRSRVNNAIRRRDTINTICALLKRAEESTGFIAASDVRKAITPWL